MCVCVYIITKTFVSYGIFIYIFIFSVIKLNIYIYLVIIFQVKGFPSKITTKGQLKDVLARIIFTPLQHHAVNYPVVYYGGFIPNMPTKLYDDPQAPSNDFSVYNLPQTYLASVRFLV